MTIASVYLINRGLRSVLWKTRVLERKREEQRGNGIKRNNRAGKGKHEHGRRKYEENGITMKDERGSRGFGRQRNTAKE